MIFDLDDTLYPERRFGLSGFAAVARVVNERYGLPRRLAFTSLVKAYRGGRRSVALQALCERFDLAADVVPELVAVIRAHVPRLRLPRASRAALQALRPGWCLGVLTNGIAEVQGRKVEALGLRPLVDRIVFAAECGSGQGKPDPAAFLTVSDQLGVPPERCVFVGDDLARDIAGASRVGMATIHIRRNGRGLRGRDEGDAVVSGVGDVPAVADRLIHLAVAHAH